MSIQAHGWHMEVESQDSALVVSFGYPPGLPDETVSAAIADKLFELAGRMAGRTLFLKLAEVSFLTSSMTGQLVCLHKRLRSSGSRLVLFALQPRVREQLAQTRLDRLLDVRNEVTATDPAGLLSSA